MRSGTCSRRATRRVDYYFGEGFENASIWAEVLVSEIADHVVPIFEDGWDDLHQLDPTSGRVRIYAFRSGIADAGIVVSGRLDAISFKEEEQIEIEITLYDIEVSLDETPLEDPDNTPNR